MDIKKIKEYLTPALKQQLTVFYFNTSTSTMLDAKTLSLKTPYLILAKDQKKAHGRFDRPFFTEEKNGIYLSLTLPFTPLLPTPEQLILMTAVALCQTIESISSLHPQIKWVNDIYLQRKKVVGILTEGVVDETNRTLEKIIIGMGINYTIPQHHFPEDLQEKVTSLFTRAPVCPEYFVASFCNHFFTLMKTDPLYVLTEYKKRLFVLNRPVSFVQNHILYKGIACDLTDHGHLVVQLENGQYKTLSSGEISLTTF